MTRARTFLDGSTPVTPTSNGEIVGLLPMAIINVPDGGTLTSAGAAFTQVYFSSINGGMFTQFSSGVYAGIDFSRPGSFSRFEIAVADGATVKYLVGLSDGTLQWDTNTIWHAGNDGAGSGLDADLLDGQSGAFYLDWANFTGVPATFAPTAHATSHQNGGADEISVLGLSGLLADAQTPLAHNQAWGTITDTPTTLAGYGITGSLAEFNTALTGADFATGGGTVTGASSGTNTGDQTSIVGITGTLAEFNAALTGADFTTGGGTATGTNTGDQTITLTGDVTGSGTGSFATALATAQPTAHTWALAQTFTVAPVFTNQVTSRAALSLTYASAGGLVIDRATGAIQADNGGNARGSGAVDLQTSRVVATQVASGVSSAVVGGIRNTASASYSGAFVGHGNVASGQYAVTIGGQTNTASGNHSAVVGGLQNSATGLYSFAAGRRSNAVHNGSFVLSDSTDADHSSAAVDELRLRFAGGVFVNGTALSTAAYVADSTLVHLAGIETITGAKTFSAALTAAGSITAGGSLVSSAAGLTDTVGGNNTAEVRLYNLTSGVVYNSRVNASNNFVIEYYNGAVWANKYTLDSTGNVTAAGSITAGGSLVSSAAGLTDTVGGNNTAEVRLYNLTSGVVYNSRVNASNNFVIEYYNGAVWTNKYTLDSTGNVTAAGSIKSSSATAGIGYATGAGGTITQVTSKATGVTLNKVSGQITMHNAALAADTTVSFVLTNSAIAATDTVIPNIQSVGTVGSYTITVSAVAAGSCTISLRNESVGSLSQAVVLNFAVIKAVTS